MKSAIAVSFSSFWCIAQQIAMKPVDTRKDKATLTQRRSSTGSASAIRREVHDAMQVKAAMIRSKASPQKNCRSRSIYKGSISGPSFRLKISFEKSCKIRASFSFSGEFTEFHAKAASAIYANEGLV
ncbi:MAG: hypothetical protein AAFX02_06745 [Pseudomonadota bacterium]